MFAAQHGHLQSRCRSYYHRRGNRRNMLKTYCPKGYADDTTKPYIRYCDCRACRNEAAEPGKDTTPSR
jgi:hypothetical protein